MKIVIGSVAAAIPLVLVDSLFFGGVYTQALLRMVSSMTGRL
jgi:hypothetical protein